MATGGKKRGRWKDGSRKEWNGMGRRKSGSGSGGGRRRCRGGGSSEDDGKGEVKRQDRKWKGRGSGQVG